MFPPFPTTDRAPRMGGATRSRTAPARSAEGRAEPRAPRRLTRPTLGDRLRHAVDLAVAFATLRDDELDLRSAHAPVGRDHPHRTPLRKSTRLNSSHANISYAVFCLKKKK